METPAHPDFLSVVEATIRADGGPPGFAGRQAIGACDANGMEWLLLEFDTKTVRASRSTEIEAARGFDCLWLVPRSDGLPKPGIRTLIDGDRALLDRISARYLQTRSHLGFQMQRITSARKPTSQKKRERR